MIRSILQKRLTEWWKKQKKEGTKECFLFIQAEDLGILPIQPILIVKKRRGKKVKKTMI